MVQVSKTSDLATKDRTWLGELNLQQLLAVTHGDGPLLVIAGAGTGKTRTIAYRVAYLMSEGAQPERILLLTFTRRAAEEMLARAAYALAGQSTQVKRVWGGTFHSIANRLLRMYAQSAGLSQDFTIIDRSDAEDLLDMVRHEMAFSSKDRRFPRKGTCMEIYSRRVNGDENLDTVLRKEFPWCQMWQQELNTLFQAYVDRKQKHHTLDYDDLLLYLCYLLEDETIAQSIGGRFDHILVDEYQDTNAIQARILMGMRLNNRNIMVVGDDAQSIYSFRSATVRNMLDFPRQFPATTIVTLEQNYRSVPSILNTTNRIIAQATQRFTKELWSTRTEGQRPRLITCFDENDQDEKVISQVLEHYEQGIPLRKQAVLFRAASHSNSLELALARRNIPYHKYGGLRFLEAAHVKDLVSMLRIVENPRDEVAWFRVLQLLDGVGPATAAAALEHVAGCGFDPCAIATFRAPPAAREQMGALGQLMKELSMMGEEGPSVQIERILSFYSPILKRNYENPDQRECDLQHLAHIAARYPSRRQFLADLILDPPVSTGDLAGPPIKDEDWLVLSTIHSAKGLEWDAVYLIHAADGNLPSDMATGNDHELEEELRLTYVAMTRARDFLYVLWPLRYYHKSRGTTDNHSYAQCCRFFTDEVIQTMDRATPKETTEHVKNRDVPVTARPRADISGRIRDIWK